MHRLVNGIPVPLTPEEVLEEEAKIAAHVVWLEQEKRFAYKSLRQAEYPRIDDLVVALIEKEEGRPEALQDLMAKRAAIKNKYPKPS